MDLELTPDHQELRAVARQALDDCSPPRLARAFLDGEAGAEPLHDLLAELGWYAVGLEPDDGFGIPGLALLAEQAGAHAAPTSLVDTAVAARLARAAGHPAAAGEAAVALAVVERGSDWSPAGAATTLHGDRLDGEKVDVQHGATVGTFAVTAVDAGGDPVVAFVDASAPGVTVTPAAGVDPAAAASVVAFADAPVSAVVSGDPAATALREAFLVGAVAATAEGLGAASAALDLAIAYAKEREQFGVPIGSFQGLKHLMAGAHVDRESAWASVLYAAAALDEGLDGAEEAAAIAKAHGARASRAVVEAALQVLGGIAFTWEHDAHLLQRRVLSTERRFGDALAYESRLGDTLATRTPTTRREEVPA
jgi:alkylation response protein AidB-like acyl-CoA dehydrogenase